MKSCDDGDSSGSHDHLDAESTTALDAFVLMVAGTPQKENQESFINFVKTASIFLSQDVSNLCRNAITNICDNAIYAIPFVVQRKCPLMQIRQCGS